MCAMEDIRFIEVSDREHRVSHELSSVESCSRRWRSQRRGQVSQVIGNTELTMNDLNAEDILPDLKVEIEVNTLKYPLIPRNYILPVGSRLGRPIHQLIEVLSGLAA